MLAEIGVSIISIIERELVNHTPEIQELLMKQLDQFAGLLFNYVQEKLMDKVEPPVEEAQPLLEHNEDE